MRAWRVKDKGSCIFCTVHGDNNELSGSVPLVFARVVSAQKPTVFVAVSAPDYVSVQLMTRRFLRAKRTMPQLESFILVSGETSRVYKANSAFQAAKKAHRDFKAAELITVKAVKTGEVCAFSASSLSFEVKKQFAIARNAARLVKEETKDHPTISGLVWSDEENGWVAA